MSRYWKYPRAAAGGMVAVGALVGSALVMQPAQAVDDFTMTLSAAPQVVGPGQSVTFKATETGTEPADLTCALSNDGTESAVPCTFPKVVTAGLATGWLHMSASWTDAAAAPQAADAWVYIDADSPTVAGLYAPRFTRDAVLHTYAIKDTQQTRAAAVDAPWSAVGRWRQMFGDGTYGAWVYPSAWTWTSPGAATVHLVSPTMQPGKTYCLNVAATDSVGNTNPGSFASNGSCTYVVRDDRGFTRSAGWTLNSNVGDAYMGTTTVTRVKGATLTASQTRVKTIYLRARTSATAGLVGVYNQQREVARFDLQGPAGLREFTKTFVYPKTGTFVFKTLTSGQRVAVDAFGLRARL